MHLRVASTAHHLASARIDQHVDDDSWMAATEVLDERPGEHRLAHTAELHH